MRTSWKDRVVVIAWIAIGAFLLGLLWLFLFHDQSVAIVIGVLALVGCIILYRTGSTWNWKPTTPQERIRFIKGGKS